MFFFEFFLKMNEPASKKMRQDSTKEVKQRIIKLLKLKSKEIELREKPSHGKEIGGLNFKVLYIHEKDVSGKFYCNKDYIYCNSEICNKKSYEERVSPVILLLPCPKTRPLRL